MAFWAKSNVILCRSLKLSQRCGGTRENVQVQELHLPASIRQVSGPVSHDLFHFMHLSFVSVFGLLGAVWSLKSPSPPQWAGENQEEHLVSTLVAWYPRGHLEGPQVSE